MSFIRNGRWALAGMGVGLVITICTALARESRHPIHWLIVVLTLGIVGMMVSFLFRHRDPGAHDSFLYGLGSVLIMALLWWSFEAGVYPPGNSPWQAPPQP